MSMIRNLARGCALSVLAAALVAPVAVYAQETTSSIRGAVTGPNGPIAGATATIVHVPSGTRATARSNADGLFVANGLRVGGPFTVDVTADGFQSTQVSDVFLQVGEPLRLPIALESAVRRETVVVTAASLGAGTDTTGASTNLRRDDIEAVVSITRDIRDIARQSPLVSANSRGDGGISIAGSNPRTNRITIDGVQAQDDFGLNTGGLPTRRGPISIDAVEQFNVAAVPFDVENGDFLGGAIDIVLRAGTNRFSGSLFGNYLNEGLVGTRFLGTRLANPREVITSTPRISQTNWGATLRGPIIPNRLFFALSYETYESIDTSLFGVVGSGAANGIIGPTGVANSLTQADIDTVTGILRTTYNSQYPAGGIPLTKPITDEKYTARIDWNITDHHRANFTYRKSESGLIQRTNISATSAGLDSQWYLTGEDDETYSFQLNSDWTDLFSTEFRISQRDYVRLQEPPAGQNFSDVQVCNSATALNVTGVDPQLSCNTAAGQTISITRFGADQFRHANFLNTKNMQAQFSGEYIWGDHTLKAGVQYQLQDVFNLFVPSSDGVYYFDSIADFRAGRANRLIYQNHPSGDANRAAADFEYSILTAFVQDTWDVSDTLQLQYGLRWDSYTVDDKPALNNAFIGRYGFNNQTTYDGLDVLMPRLGFKWDATDTVRIAGGLGLFSGGLPDVFLSNSFSNTGVLTSQIDIQRNVDGTFREATGAPGFSQTIGADALNNLANAQFGTRLPASVQALLGGAIIPPTNETNSIAPNFKIPSDWKANISVTADLFDGWRFGGDVVVTAVNEGLAFRDIRAQRLIVNGQQARTPDGRIRYDGLTGAQRTQTGQVVTSTNPGANRDIQAYNPTGDLGVGFIAALSVGKFWDNGINFDVAYTWQDIEARSGSARFSSTASSLFNSQQFALDPNDPVYGRSEEEIRNAIKFNLGWRGEVFGDLETRVSLFGDYRSGRPYTFTMNPGTGRNAVTGTNGTTLLAYVPDMSGTLAPLSTATGAGWAFSSDNRVAFDSQASAEQLRTLVGQLGLAQGSIVGKGIKNNPEIFRLDAQIAQDLPTFWDGHKVKLTLDIQNVLNLINARWGLVEEYPEAYRLYNVACGNATGVADNLGAVACNRYRISAVNTTQDTTRNTDLSRWQVQIGLRYEF